MGDRPVHRLDDLVIGEASGVDHPANLMSGWIVTKAEKPPPGAIRTALAARAEALGLEIDDDALDALVAEAEAAGGAFDASAWDARLRAASKSEEDADDKKKPKPKGHQRGSRGKAPQPKGGDSAVTPESQSGNSANVQMAAPDRLVEATLRYRQSLLTSETGVQRVAANARTLQAGSPRMSTEEAVAKAVAGATTGAGAAATIEAVAKSLVAAGTSPGQARVEAARLVADHLHRQLAARESGGPAVRKEVSEARAGIAADIRIGRARRGLSQTDLADACSVSVQTVRSWEAATSLPAPLHATKLAAALGGGLEMAKSIAQARDQR